MTDTPAILPATKVCTKCGESKPLNAFVRAKRNYSGLASICKECAKKQHEKWRNDNKDKIELYNKNYRKVADKRKYSEKTDEQKAKARAAFRAWYKANAKKLNESRRRVPNDDYSDLIPVTKRHIGFRSWAVITSPEYAKELTVWQNADMIEKEPTE